MNSSDWNEIKDLFGTLLELPQPDRDIALLKISIDNPEHRRELMELLASLDRAPDFLETPVTPPLSALAREGHDVFLPGETVGDFRIESNIASGAFATVYLAHQLTLNRRVALKASINFGNEAKTMASLEHDHIVRVFSETIDASKHLRLICMQYIAGTSLEQLLHSINERGTQKSEWNFLREKPFEWILETCRDVTLALDYAHSKGVLHLDVKPANILVDSSGKAFLTDFNIALKEGDAENRMLGGTLEYMAPEQSQLFTSIPPSDWGQHIDGRADQYAMGLVLKQMLETAHLDSATGQIGCLIHQETQESREKRSSSAKALAQQLQSCLENHRLQEALPPKNWIAMLTLRYPRLTTAVFGLIPQVFGSFINISYNSIQIVGHLSTQQQRVFEQLVLAYNAVIYPLCVIIFSSVFWKVPESVKAVQSIHAMGTQRRQDLRHYLIHLPGRVFIVTAVGWIPGSLFFPLGIDTIAGPIAWAVYTHFIISFILSWLVSLTYTLLFFYVMVPWVFHPGLLTGEVGLSRVVRREFGNWLGNARQISFMSAFVPLVGAIIIVMLGPGRDPHSMHVYQALVGFLIGLGILGLILSARIMTLISDTWTALTTKY